MPLQPGGGTGTGIWLLRDVSEVTRSPQWLYSQMGERGKLAGWLALAGWLGCLGWLGWLAWAGWAGLAGVKYRTLWEAGGCIWTPHNLITFKLSKLL